MYLNRFFYNAEEGEGGGEPPNLEQPDNQPPAEVLLNIPQNELEALGFKSFDELKQHFNKPAEPTEEEKQQNAHREKADFLKFGTDEKLITVDDFQQYEAVKAKQNADLVFENFKADYLEDNPDSDDADAEYAFKQQYHLDSDNPTLKRRGEKILAKEADELRKPFEDKHNTAWSKYQERNELNKNVPKWNSFVDEKVSKVVPAKLKAFEKKIGEENIAIEIELSDADREEIANKFKLNIKGYDLFTKGDTAKLNAELDRKINGYIQEKYAEQVKEQIFEKGIEEGRKKGSNVGATAPFALVQNGGVVRTLPSKDVLEQMRESHAVASKVR